jgi:hypothetical protein
MCNTSNDSDPYPFRCRMQIASDAGMRYRISFLIPCLAPGDHGGDAADHSAPLQRRPTTVNKPPHFEWLKYCLTSSFHFQTFIYQPFLLFADVISSFFCNPAKHQILPSLISPGRHQLITLGGIQGLVARVRCNAHYMQHYHVGSELPDSRNAKENHRGTCGQHYK